jgi:hypothetical protein
VSSNAMSVSSQNFTCEKKRLNVKDLLDIILNKELGILVKVPF